jgi:hypothetical protein
MIDTLMQFDTDSGDLIINNTKLGPSYVATNLPVFANSNLLIGLAAFFQNPVHVAALPPAGTNKGSVRLVDDAMPCSWHAVVAGGGAGYILVFSNGTSWIAL